MPLELTPFVNRNLMAKEFTVANKKPNECKWEVFTYIVFF